MTIAICYDGHFLEDDASEQLERADVLLFPSAWVDGEDSRTPLFESLVRGFGVAIVNANWGKGVVEVTGQGESCIIAAGRIAARVPKNAVGAQAIAWATVLQKPRAKGGNA